MKHSAMLLKKILVFSVLIIFYLHTFSQTRIICDSLKNEFLFSEEMYNIYSMVDTIYPNGRINFKRDSLFNFAQLLTHIEIDSNITFESISKMRSHVDSSTILVKYQQFYKDIIVKGGGYTESYYSAPGGPDNPCLVPLSVNPYLLSGINLDTDSAGQVYEIAINYGITAIDSSQLFIELNSNCQYLMYYYITYRDSTLKVSTSKFNAVSGIKILDLEQGEYDKPANTRDFGQKPMNDSPFDQNTTWLVSEDNVLRTYNYQNIPYSGELSRQIKEGNEPTNENIPTVSSSEEFWPSDEGLETTYQTHYIADGMLKYLKSDFNIEFEEVHFICNSITLGAFNPLGIKDLPHGTLDKAIIVVGDYTPPGQMEEVTWAFPSIIGHELAHPILHSLELGFDKIDDDNFESNASLHEAISEMFAVYLRSKLLGNAIIWQTGDELNGFVDPASLSDPEYKCFTEVADFTHKDLLYERAQPLEYWFYLCVHGDESLGIPSIDAKKVLDIVIDAVFEISSKSDYEDLMNETLITAVELYGRCSDEFIALARAWEEICVPTSFLDPITHEIPQCNFSLEGPIYVCEETEYLNVYLVNAFTSYNYIWTLIGQKSTQYESTYGMTGNGQYGGLNIELIDFPTHNFYPQKLTIKAYCPALGHQYITMHNVILVDCDQDDPTCDEYYEMKIDLEQQESALSKDENLKFMHLNGLMLNDEIMDSSNYSFTRIFSFDGEQLYFGNIYESYFQANLPSIAYFLVHYDKSGKILRVDKKVNIH